MVAADCCRGVTQDLQRSSLKKPATIVLCFASLETRVGAVATRASPRFPISLIELDGRISQPGSPTGFTAKLTGQMQEAATADGRALWVSPEVATIATGRRIHTRSYLG